MATDSKLTSSDESQSAEYTRSGQFYRPNVDIRETTDDLVLVADVPGARSEDIDINFEDGTLAVHAKVNNRQTNDTVYLLQEYGVGDFYRTFKVSEQIDSTRISAEYHDGVLTIHLPKIEAAKPRKISVQSS